MLLYYNQKQEGGSAMHYVSAKGILSAGNGMNLYRGCQHGCIYCDARSHCYQMPHEFEDIEVKENAIPLLEDALRRKRRPCMIGTGAMSDPYIPLEERLCHMRQALELIYRYGFGLALQTKSARVLRDLDLLAAINRKAKCVVQMTLTTYDETLCRKLEPAVSTTRERVEALTALRSAGIPTVVWLCPILPFLNDTEENINGILSYCEESGVLGIINFGMGLTLRDGNREYFYRQLDRHFPGLKEEYIRRYGNSYALPSPNSQMLLTLFRNRCERAGLWHDNDRIFRYLAEFPEQNEQLSLF